MTLVDWLVGFFSNPFFIFSMIFWLVTYILVRTLGKKRELMTFYFPFLVMARTKKLNQWLKKVARKAPRMWRWYWNIGIFVSFAFTFYGIYFFTNNLIELFTSPSIENAITPLIPGVTVDFPLLSYLILPLLFAVTIHEFSHAMAAEADNLDVKSTGVFGAGIFFIIGFGAFVEIDEFASRSKKYSPWTRLRIAGAGTFSNAIMALIGFGLILSSVTIISWGYGANVFQVDYVLPSDQGGYNEGVLFVGDIVFEINGTPVDLQNGASLTDILTNKTDLNVEVGNTLNLSVLTVDGDVTYRYITLGNNFFIGFTASFVSETELEVTEVHSKLRGGNNDGILEVGMRFNAIDGYTFSNITGRTINTFKKTLNDEGKYNLTLIDGENISIFVNNFPRVAGAFEFQSFFTGMFFERTSDTVVTVDKVLSNLTESGINEDHINRGDKVIKVNGIDIDLSNNKTFESFLIDDVGIVITEETEIIFTIDSDSGSGEIEKAVIFKPIPKTYVYIGVMQSSYWMPENWFSSMLGGTFPLWLQREFLYFFMISFSLTLFNMMPVPAFDGIRIVREIINAIVGKKMVPGEKKKILLEFDPKESEYQLMTLEITSIDKVEMKLNDREEFEFTEELKYEGLDVIGDDCIDTIVFDLESTALPPKGTLFEIDITYNEDKREPLKKRIYWGIGISSLALIVANFVLSAFMLGDMYFWL